MTLLFEVLLLSIRSSLVKAIDKEIQELYVKVKKVRMQYELMLYGC